MKSTFLPFLLLACLAGLPATSSLAGATSDSSTRWLEAELPPKVSLQGADCEQLAAAVGKATLVHRPEAPAILLVALTRGVRQLKRGEGGKLPCAGAKHILGVSVATAPAQASALLDLATELYPACAGELAEVMRDYDRVDYDYKDRVNDKNVADSRNVAARGTTAVPSDPAAAGADQPSFDPGTGLNRGDLSDQDVAGIGFGDANGFQNGGLSAGFPGSPNFVGSPPDGGLALPPTPVTASVNG